MVETRDVQSLSRRSGVSWCLGRDLFTGTGAFRECCLRPMSSSPSKDPGVTGAPGLRPDSGLVRPWVSGVSRVRSRVVVYLPSSVHVCGTVRRGKYVSTFRSDGLRPYLSRCPELRVLTIRGQTRDWGLSSETSALSGTRRREVVRPEVVSEQLFFLPTLVILPFSLPPPMSTDTSVVM